MAALVLAVMPTDGTDMTIDTIRSAVGVNGDQNERHAVANTMLALERRGAVVKHGRGVYARPTVQRNSSRKMNGAHSAGALQAEILAAVNGPTDVSTIAATLGRNKRSLSSTITGMVRKGLLVRSGRGTYKHGKHAPTPTLELEAPAAAQVRQRVTQDDKLAAMLDVSNVRPKTEDEWLAVLQLIECARGVL
jgi:hypothetical protein